MLPLSGDRQPRPLRRTRFNESQAEFSPNGRWLAYASNESGRPEVYVQPYPGPGRGQPISTGGGNSPVWSRNGRELFFMTPAAPGGADQDDGCPSDDGADLHGWNTPNALRGAVRRQRPVVRQYDVAPDGNRFLMMRAVERPRLKLTQMILVQNWFEELKRRVPTN